MKRLLLPILILSLSGCFEEQPKIPQYIAQQNIDVATDSVICHSFWEGFENYVIYNSNPYDSVHWFKGNSFVSNDDTLFVPTGVNGWSQINCLAFNGTDTIEHSLQLNYCGRFIYIPTAFTNDGDGVNEYWQPIVNFEADPVPYSIYWEIRTLDGVKVFSTSDPNGRWDGYVDGYLLPRGAYLFYIELTIGSEEPVIYTGSLDMIG
ncbi:MAG: gliding motility-associated C-terminal domain-containing protein [Flavobacteriales bacterium]|nr:gliding motility-associated C-terminal domain-containing protein [Flavobacteriales bacterium]